MTMLLGMLLATAAVSDGGDVAALEQLWSGVRDSSEQVVVNTDSGSDTWPQVTERAAAKLLARTQQGEIAARGGAHIAPHERGGERRTIVQVRPLPRLGKAQQMHVHGMPGITRRLQLQQQLSVRMSGVVLEKLLQVEDMLAEPRNADGRDDGPHALLGELWPGVAAGVGVHHDLLARITHARPQLLEGRDVPAVTDRRGREQHPQQHRHHAAPRGLSAP